jgi:hypothetical protein
MIGHTKDLDLNVLRSGTIRLKGRYRNVSIFCKNRKVNPNMLKALHEEFMLVRVYCPCQVSSVTRILENITELSCYSKNCILTTSNNTLPLLSDKWKERDLVLL